MESQKHVKCAVRTERWRLVNNGQLFDITADPSEKNDVSADYPEEVARLQTSFDQWWDSAKPLMVNEGLPSLKQAEQPLGIRYQKQLNDGGISDWEPAEKF